MPHLNLNGERIYYTLHRNDPQGMPVALIHGAGENHLSWPMGLRRLPGAIVHALDLPGHGKSAGAGYDSIEAYAAWMAAFADALTLNRVVLIGHSMGGAIAQSFALKYPDRTAGLVLIATSAKLRVAPQLLELAQNDLAATVDLVMQWAWGPLVPDAIKRLGKQQLLATKPAIMLSDYRACDVFDVRQRLHEVKVPTLIVAGEADQMTPLKHATFMAEQMPWAQLIPVPQAGHMVMLEAEEVVTRAVTEFMREIRNLVPKV